MHGDATGARLSCLGMPIQTQGTIRVSDHVTESNLESAPAKLAWWRFIPWVLASCCLIALLWMRFGVEVGDFGFLNVLSYMLVFAGLIFGFVAMVLTTSPRVWLTGMMALVAAGAVLFACFRIDRVDSEIVPKFVWRWTEAAALPESSGGVTVAEDSFFSARETDYPQFLGPNANSTLPTIDVESDWKEHPPKIAWKQPIGKGWSGFAVQGNAAYTMEQREQEEWVSCYDADSGQLLWHYAIPGLHFHPLGGTGPRATPSIYEGRVYAQSAVSNLVCLDMRTGELIWSFDMLKATNSTQSEFEALVSWGRSGSPVIVDGKVIAALGGAASSNLQPLIALDAKTGNGLYSNAICTRLAAAYRTICNLKSKICSRKGGYHVRIDPPLLKSR